MSDSEASDVHALHELETLVHHLADELAGFRRRALVAESKLKDVESSEGGAVNLDLSNRVSQLEAENQQLRLKLDGAMSRAKQMLDRVKFLRQQAQGGER